MSLRIIFMGTPDFAVPSLRALIAEGMKPVLCVSQPDRPQGRKRICLPTPVKEAAEAAGIPVFQPTKVRDQVFYDTLASYEPDLIVTAAYGRILTRAVLDLPRLGCINVHGSLLPKYRGASPVQWSILNQDEETGVTIVQMTEALDAGAILRQRAIPLDRTYTADRLMKTLAELGADILPQTVRDWAEGKILPLPQDESKVCEVGLLDRETGRIDWTASADQIDAQIRGTTPWPGAYTFYKNKRFKILEAEPLVRSSLPADWPMPLNLPFPGSRIPSPKQSFWIACGEGILSVLRFQPEGSRPQTATECAHNYPPDLLLESDPSAC